MTTENEIIKLTKCTEAKLLDPGSKKILQQNLANSTKIFLKILQTYFRNCGMKSYVLQRWSRGHKARGQGQGHKKIRGQGQPFRGQNLSKPRTGMLEAKAKDQGHRRKRSKKKGFQKFLSGDLQFIGVPRIFDWERTKPQTT